MDKREGAGKGRGRGGGREGEERGWKRRDGKGREGGLTPTFLYPPPPLHTITNRLKIIILKFQIDCPSAEFY